MADFGVHYGLQGLVKFKYKNCQLNVSGKALLYINPKNMKKCLKG